jgi:hypothetical protein
MMKVREIAPEPNTGPLLAGAHRLIVPAMLRKIAAA